MKTIKMIADELGIDKQRVYRHIKRNCISEAHHDTGVMWYDEVAETLIKGHFGQNNVSGEANQTTSVPHHTASHDTATDAVIQMLKQELDIKNRQIDDLNTANKDLIAALVVAQQTAAAAQALHAGTMQVHLTDKEDVRHQPGYEVTEEKKGWIFKRLFGRE